MAATEAVDLNSNGENLKVDLSILMVNYNTREMTLDCLRTLFEHHQDVLLEVILVDNGSHDGSVAAIAERFPQVRLIASDENLGFAKANNMAARHATGEYLLLLNTDMRFDQPALGQFLDFAAKHSEAKVWGGRTVFGDGSLNPMSCAGRMTNWSLFCQVTGLKRLFRSSERFNPEYIGQWQRDETREVDVVVGCLLLVTRDFWNELGGLDEIFFIYGEDVDFCLRAAELGARPMMTPEVEVVHYGSASSKNAVPQKWIWLLGGKSILIRRHSRAIDVPLGLVLLQVFVLLNLVGARLNGLVGRSSQGDQWAEIWGARSTWLNGFEST